MQAAETKMPGDVDQNMNCMEVWGGSGATSTCLRRPGLDVWVRSQPQSKIESGGGDLHLLSSCASGRITRMLLADVCGFGSLFAEIAAELRDIMKKNVNSIQQARVVRRMSLRLDEASRRGGFASTMMSTYFAPTRSFTLCNAGHAPPLLFRAASGEWSILKQMRTDATSVDSPPGVVGPNEYQQFKLRLGVGDMVLSYSNVLTECRSLTGGIIGLVGLLKRVRRLDATRPQELITQLLTQVQSEHMENLTRSDTTVLLCRASEVGVRWQDNVLAPFRLLGSVADRTRIE